MLRKIATQILMLTMVFVANEFSLGRSNADPFSNGKHISDRFRQNRRRSKTQLRSESASRPGSIGDNQFAQWMCRFRKRWNKHKLYNEIRRQLLLHHKQL